MLKLNVYMVFFKLLPPSWMHFLQHCCHFSNTWCRPFFVRSLRIASLFFSTASDISNRIPWSFVFCDGNKKKSLGARLGLKGGNVKFSQKLHDIIRDVRLCIVMMKSPSSPMMLWPFLCNVLLQFSQHWRVLHLHRTLAAVLHKFQRLYALSGNRIVLLCTSPRDTSTLWYAKNKWGRQHRAVLPTYQQESVAAFVHYTWNLALFKYSWYRQITIKAATGQTQSQSLLISPRIYTKI